MKWARKEACLATGAIDDKEPFFVVLNMDVARFLVEGLIMSRGTDSTSFPFKRCRGGFTLIEILAVVVIMGIVSAVVVPQLGTRDDQKAASAARVVMADLMYAQNLAISTQKTHYIQFNIANQSYQVLDSWSPANVVGHPVSGSPYKVVFGSSSGIGLTQMQLTSASFDNQTVLAFDAMGVPYSVNPSTAQLTALGVGNIIVASGSFQMTVNVAPFSGELTVQ